MKSKLAKIELERFIQIDAAEIVAAREKCILIHHTKDINAAGDEVEIVVRNVFNRKLPDLYYVGHGHIVDEEMTTSPQLDVIISDKQNVPVLFTAENKTEYFPFESIFCIGEIKSTYYRNSNYLKSFVNTITDIKSNLKREKTPKEYIGNGITLGGSLKTDLLVPYRNPLMSFMLFVNSGDFKIEDVVELYKSTEDIYLPNIVCFLDKGCLVNAQIIEEEDFVKLNGVNPKPEFITTAKKDSSKWIFIPFGKDENRIGSNFGFLYFLIFEHLSTTVLMKPKLLNYMQRMFHYGEGTVII